MVLLAFPSVPSVPSFPVPESDAPPRRFNTDRILSGAAIFISLCTLAILLYQAKIMREQQRASVWPYVEIGPGFSGDGFHIFTYNQGVGPALIRSMEVTVDGEPVRSWPEMFGALGVGATSWSHDLTNGRVIPAQSQIGTLQAAGGERAATVREAYLSATPRLALALCYCSVYDECWRLRVQGLDEERTPVAACEADPSSDFPY